MIDEDSTLARLGEFGVIARMVRHMPTGKDSLLGPGDDAAVISAPDRKVVACTDVMVEGRHFRRDWSGASDVGHRAAASSLADVAAMGARSTGLLVGLTIPPDLPVGWVEELSEGLASESAAAGTAVVGGDTVSGRDITISVTALGDLSGQPAVTRSGARPGDLLAMTGRVGWAAAGMTILSRGFRSPGALVAAYRRPQVPYDAGPLAAVLGATAMIDVSDGLMADVGHIACASEVSIDIDSVSLSIPDDMRNAGQAMGVEPLTWLLTGGEDHALAATFPPDVLLGPDWTVIGSVAEGKAVTVDGAEREGTVGWDHFA